MDWTWWKAYADIVRGGSELWTTSQRAFVQYGLNFIRSEPGGGMPKHEGVIRQGGNSGFQAVQLAILFGAARVILLGYDMQATGGKLHWHGNHAGIGNPVPDRMPKWIEAFGQMAKAVRGVKIINATRETALRCFKRLPLDDCL